MEVHIVERTSMTLQALNVPEEQCFSPEAYFTELTRAEGYAHECRRLCKIRKVRVRTVRTSQWGA